MQPTTEHTQIRTHGHRSCMKTYEYFTSKESVNVTVIVMQFSELTRTAIRPVEEIQIGTGMQQNIYTQH